MSSDSLSRDELIVLADSVVRRGYQLRLRRKALLASAVAAVASVVVGGMLLSFGASEESLKTVDRPGVTRPGPTFAIDTDAPPVDSVPAVGLTPPDAPPGVVSNMPTTTAGPQAINPLSGRIAYVSDRDGYSAIYVMNADGSDNQRLSNLPFPDMDPAWSPDGSRIAFSSLRDGTKQIYVVNADGSKPMQLTSTGANAEWPTWSPDGTRIAYDVMDAQWQCGGIAGTPPRLWLMNADGTDQHPITGPNDPAYTCGQLLPAWSPDGTRIAYVDDSTSQFGAYIKSIDVSTGEIRNEATGAWGPSWSPDGKYIAYIGGHTLRVVEAGGMLHPRDVLRFDDATLFAQRTAWSSDGQHLLWVQWRCTNGYCPDDWLESGSMSPQSIWSVGIDGSFPTQLTSGNANDSSPSITH